MSTGRPEALPPEERAGAGSAEGTAGGEEGVVKKRMGGSAVVWTPTLAAIRRQLDVTKSGRDVRCRARQVQVRGWSASPGRTAVPQPHRRMGAFAGPAGRPRWRRADDTKSESESDRARGKEVGMMSNQMEAGRHAQQHGQVRVGLPRHHVCVAPRHVVTTSTCNSHTRRRAPEGRAAPCRPYVPYVLM
jgi:hypothetical protein